VIVVDANILLYAYDADAARHADARRWLEHAIAGPEWIGIPWLALWAFVRITTNHRVNVAPLAVADAFEIIRTLLAHPNVNLIEPGARHAEILERLATTYQVTGPLVTDAVLAALALEYGATLASTDRGFARFTELHWVNPLAA
jgi:uncharacterized protein